MTLHDLLDWDYGADGDEVLRRALIEGADPNRRAGPFDETLLHVATRRRRRGAVEVLLEGGAEIEARTKGGKTAYVHAVRRDFHEVAELLRRWNARPDLNEADRFAVAVVHGRTDKAAQILNEHPGVIQTGNPEEDRLLADVAGRSDLDTVDFLVRADADLEAPGLDDGTPLHQAAWFGQPTNARLLIDAGAPLDVFDSVHESSPLGWAVHGSRYSGGAEEGQDEYLALVEMLFAAGSSLHYPDDPKGEAYLQRLLDDANPRIRGILGR